MGFHFLVASVISATFFDSHTFSNLMLSHGSILLSKHLIEEFFVAHRSMTGDGMLLIQLDSIVSAFALQIWLCAILRLKVLIAMNSNGEDLVTLSMMLIYI